MRRASLLPAICALLLFAAPAHAAFITWDDNDLNQITITAGDFNGGFYVDGNLLTFGSQESNSITLADTSHTFSGIWLDVGTTGSGNDQTLFALPSDPTGVTSGVAYSYSTDGFVATIAGTFGGFNGGVYSVTGDPTLAQDGRVEFFTLPPFLNMSFDSEAPAAVPEPPMLLTLGPAMAFLALRRFARR